jgi:gliding motility-associated-like protein
VNPFEIICLNDIPFTLEIQSALTVYDYTWEDDQGNNYAGEEIEIRNGGTYTVTASTTDGTNCSRMQQIIVQESNIANITSNDVSVVDDSENNSITIDPTNLGIGTYEYALQNDSGFETPYQNEPFFENLEGGIYTIFVRDKNGCGIASLLVPVIEFPKFFTPNNDSTNDTWIAKGLNSEFFPGSQIFIFNRYGKQLTKLDIDGSGWDGMYNGRSMPSDDYWFSVKIVVPNGQVKERQGHFSLLRK